MDFWFFLQHASKILFLAPFLIFLFVFFLCVPQISPESLNGFSPNLKGRRAWSLAQMSLNVEVKGQGHQGPKRTQHCHHPPSAMEWNVLAANNITQQQTTADSTILLLLGVIAGASVWCMFGITSLALVFF